jgi:endonuclease-3
MEQHTTDPDLLRSIFDRLHDRYGPFHLIPSETPIDELIATILSQHTSDVNTARAFASLRARFREWDAVVAAPVEEVAESIRSGGLSNIKAPRIQAVLREVETRIGGFDLRFLQSMPIGEAREWLTTLPGVGPKTAACVLLFSLGMPALPVDTHVHRVAVRIGLVPEGTPAERTWQPLEAALGGTGQEVYALHMSLILHGRRTCTARRPRCGECPVMDDCDYYKQHPLQD